MNSCCIFVLALALFGAIADAYVGTVYPYGGVCRGGYGVGYGVGYGAGCGGALGGTLGAGYGATCASPCGATVCDTCQCVKTVVRPPVVERIPYSCSRRVQAPGVYSTGTVGAGYINGGYGGYSGGYGSGVVV